MLDKFRKYAIFLLSFQYFYLMENILKEKLSQIGFSIKESTIYLELLRLGPQPVSTISKRLNINRSTTYSTIQSLLKKGIVSFYNNGSMKYFVANDPNSIVGYLDRQSKTYDYYRSQLLAAIPRIRCMNEDLPLEKPIVTHHEGMEGVRHLMYDALNYNGEFRSYMALHKWLKKPGMKEFLLEFKNRRTIDMKLPLKALTPDTKEVRAFFEDNYDLKSDLTRVKFVKDSSIWDIFENQMNIYDGKVAILHLDEGAEFGVVIQSKTVSDMHKMIFDINFSGFNSN